MPAEPVVSVVIIFLNEERFLAEAVDSVLAQTYEAWELLLVDDGSTDASTEIARSYAAQQPNQITYLEHPGHTNRGMSASRNLGIRRARGSYIALLDADDVWLPYKLQEQVALLEANPEAGMLYGQSLYWFSWTQKREDRQRDCMPAAGPPSGALVPPPRLLPKFLLGETAVPCPSSIMVRASVMAELGGFVETFTGVYSVYEDQAFYSKACLRTPILACESCWDYYRQHSGASTAISRRTGQDTVARQFFLDWLQQYLHQQGVTDATVWRALRQELWLWGSPAWLPRRVRALLRWGKKWIVRLESHLLPSSLSHRLWGGAPQ